MDDVPWLVDVPSWFEDLPNAFVVVHRDDDRLYWTGFPHRAWSRRASDALWDEANPWVPNGNPVPREGRCVRMLQEAWLGPVKPIYKWPVQKGPPC